MRKLGHHHSYSTQAKGKHVIDRAVVRQRSVKQKRKSGALDALSSFITAPACTSLKLPGARDVCSARVSRRVASFASGDGRGTCILLVFFQRKRDSAVDTHQVSRLQTYFSRPHLTVTFIWPELLLFDLEKKERMVCTRTRTMTA